MYVKRHFLKLSANNDMICKTLHEGGKKKYMKSNQMEKNGELEGDFFRIEEQCGLFSYTIN